jgi:hypothetical protein
MRRRIACITIATLAALAPAAQAQTEGFYWKPVPAPEALGYYGLGSQVAENCATALQFASRALYQERIAEAIKRGEKPDQKLINLGYGLKPVSKIYPFLESSVVDRTKILDARATCGADPRAASLAPDQLRARLNFLVKGTDLRASICGPLEDGTTAMLATEFARLQAKGGGQLDPIDVTLGMGVAEAAAEMSGDLAALCPGSGHAALAANAAKLRAALAPLIPAMFEHPDFLHLLGMAVNAAQAVATTAGAADVTDAKIRGDCGMVLLTHWTLGKSAGFALPAYVAQKATPREKAALAMREACWKTVADVKAAARTFPPGPRYDGRYQSDDEY